MTPILAAISFIVMDAWDDLLINVFKTLMGPYVQYYGAWTFGVLFGLTAAIVYTHSKNMVGVFIILLVTGSLGSAMFPTQVGLFLGLMVAFMIAGILWKAFFQER